MVAYSSKWNPNNSSLDRCTPALFSKKPATVTSGAAACPFECRSSNARTLVTGRVVTAFLPIEKQVGHAHSGRVPGSELLEDFLSLPKTSRQIPSSRFPIVDGKTSIRHSAIIFFVDNKEG